MTVERRAFPVSDILSQLVTECTETARQKNIDLIAVNSSAIVESDPVLLSRLLRNLLRNAIKYTEQSRILFGCRDGDRFLPLPSAAQLRHLRQFRLNEPMRRLKALSE